MAGESYDLKLDTLKRKPSPFEICLILALVVVVAALTALCVVLLISIGNLENSNSDRQGTTTRPPPNTNKSALTKVHFIGQFTDTKRPYKKVYMLPENPETVALLKAYEKSLLLGVLASNLLQNPTVKIVQLSSSYRTSREETGNLVTAEFWLTGSREVSFIPSEETVRRFLTLLFRKWTAFRVQMVVPQNEPRLHFEQTMNSTGWTMAEKMLEASIDFAADPCDDFYRFACGQWQANHPVTDSMPVVTSFSLARQQIYDTILKLVRKIDANDESVSRPLRQARIAFNNCAESSPTHYNGSELLDQSAQFEGWPLIGVAPIDPAPSRSHFAYMSSLLFSQHGINTLISVDVDTNWAAPQANHMLMLDQATALFPPAFYADAVAQRYNRSRLHMDELIKRVARKLALVYNATNVLDEQKLSMDVDALLDLDKMIGRQLDTSEHRPNASAMINLFTALTAVERWPNFNWQLYILKLLQPHGLADLSATLTFTVVDLDYFDWLNDHVLAVSNVTLQNYLQWRLLFNHLSFMPTQLFEDDFAAYRRGVGEQAMALPPPDTRCIAQLVQTLPFATGKLYIDGHYKKLDDSNGTQITQEVAKMTDKMIDEFERMISTVSWLTNDVDAYQMAKMKGDSLKQRKNIAYPLWLDDRAQFEAAHPVERLNISATDDYFMTVQKQTKFQLWNLFRLLRVPGNTRTHSFRESPATVAAWYLPERNSITVPAGILNQPYFRANFPEALKFGALGSVLGHEVAHAFGLLGMQFDSTGKLNNWLNGDARSGFDQMAACVNEEYGSFCYENLSQCVNGQRTLEENIADNAGIRAAFNAYKQATWFSGAQPPLHGKLAKFSMDQLFFLGFGQMWCANVLPGPLGDYILTNKHSPPEYRVKGTVRNFPAFAEAFHCPLGSPMAPYPPAPNRAMNVAAHCNVWIGG